MGDFLANLGNFWDIVRHPLGAAACLAGALLCVVSAIGVLRFPDFYTRLHAASITDTSGAALVLIGMALMAPHWLVLVKLLCIFIFLFLTSPTGSHALANAAHVAGLQPRIGRIGADTPEDEA
ncbi:monovalent cation/proton antiporter, MnhG/PhaG family [Hyphomonas neptunium ATCC 15444]|uniref:Monovalent cation/proton antiporter, MnhG/PhaG family n=2 Tax=Hyphomonas TaxID=85 RepID=Q0C484_HYPNA|nr:MULTISPECIES: monovalent cation/H(+) antiporter subunit G [Hyphomonas]ABI75544.1 monovalent cation/proton antiporter, MnhG/PhaG family [Hyphomonas neptunium ATCC 15444]KCZ96327.1 MnhG/PhaG family monovalent cation/proton antiporter [Hyphomonas hirschiana VP5]